MSTLEQSVPGVRAVPARRRNRRWLVLMMLTPLCLVAVALLAYATNGPSEPVVHPRVLPSGYQAVTNAYFGFAVPSAWTPQTEWSDQTGDVFLGHPASFVAESLIVPKLAPTIATPPPRVLDSFGVTVPVPTRIVGRPTAVSIPGTTAAWEMTVARPGGWRATALDVWEGSTTSQLWLLMHTAPSTVTTVLSSLQGP